MTITIHQPHDKYFKRNLKEKKVAIDVLKSYLEPELFKKIDLNSLALTEKSFVVPQLREIHSDIIYKCLINDTPGYLHFLFEHQSTPDPFMAFRFLHSMVSLSYEHILQGNKKLPIVLPFCMYHGEAAGFSRRNSEENNYDFCRTAKRSAQTRIYGNFCRTIKTARPKAGPERSSF